MEQEEILIIMLLLMLIKKFVEGVTFRIDYVLNVFPGRERGELNILAGLRLSAYLPKVWIALRRRN